MIQIIDNFLPPCEGISRAEEARQKFLAAGFGTWQPESHVAGSGIYEGMSFQGPHELFVHAIMLHLGRPIIPGSMFARITNQDTERAFVHSDRSSGAFTCIVYLSDHAEFSGTAFYRHRETGLTEMPEEWLNDDQRKQEMVEGRDEVWERMDVVRGLFNKAVIFSAPLFHSRYPMNGISTGENRLIWCSHFYIPTNA